MTDTDELMRWTLQNPRLVYSGSPKAHDEDESKQN